MLQLAARAGDLAAGRLSGGDSLFAAIIAGGIVCGLDFTNDAKVIALVGSIFAAIVEGHGAVSIGTWDVGRRLLPREEASLIGYLLVGVCRLVQAWTGR